MTRSEPHFKETFVLFGNIKSVFRKVLTNICNNVLYIFLSVFSLLPTRTFVHYGQCFKFKFPFCLLSQVFEDKYFAFRLVSLGRQMKEIQQIIPLIFEIMSLYRNLPRLACFV
jgi:hypothetical protein